MSKNQVQEKPDLASCLARAFSHLHKAELVVYLRNGFSRLPDEAEVELASAKRLIIGLLIRYAEVIARDDDAQLTQRESYEERHSPN